MSSNVEFKLIALPVAQAARQLSIGRIKVYELIQSGELKTLKFGRRTLITAVSLRALLNRAGVN